MYICPMATRLTHKIACTALVAAAFCASPAFASDWSIGGAWGTLGQTGESTAVETQVDTSDTPDVASLAFAAPSTTRTESALTIGYALPAFGASAISTDLAELDWDDTASVSERSQPVDVYGTYSTSVLGGEVGVFGGVADSRSAFSMEPTTSRTVGASVGYAGFYLRGAYQDAGPDGLLDGRRAWQAGLGYGSDDFDLRVTYVQSEFLQGSPTELEGKQWMIGGLVQLTPSILLNANAFYIDREMIMPTVEPPGTGARVGLQLRF